MEVTSHANALDSLHRTAAAAAAVRQGEPLSLKEVLQWGWHAVALLAYMGLRPAREELDPWLWDYLEAGEAALDVERDARWDERQRLSLLELVDILSAEELPLLEPRFYQGWQERGERCRTLRRQTRSALGASIGGEERQGLVYLLAAYHRLLRLPAAVSLDTAPAVAALPRLFDRTAGAGGRGRGSLGPSLQLRHHPGEPVQGLQVVQGLLDPFEVQGDVLVDHRVAETGQGAQLLRQLVRELRIGCEIADRLRIILEPQAPAGRQLARDVDDQLADGQQGEKHIVVQGKISLEIAGAPNLGADLPQVIHVAPQLGQAVDEVRHLRRSSKVRRRARSSQGARSAARIWMSRT